jgi:hypothetical protein
MTWPRFLKLRSIPDAAIVPRPVHTDKSAGAGVVRRDGDGWVRVPDTGVRRRGRQYVEPPPTTGVEPVRRIDTAVYGGFIYEHYGHFLLESLGRLWFDQVDPDIPIVWIPATGGHLAPWMSEMADLIGVGAERLVVDGVGGPLEVGELLVADQGFEVHRYLHPWFRSRLGICRARPDPEGLRLWLSRSALGDMAGVDDEALIEQRLAEHGWTVVHLEHHPLPEQIDLLSRATCVAGIEGSAFHTLLFVNDFGGTIDLFTRHDNPNFEVIANEARWDQVRHPLHGGSPREWWRDSGARDVSWSGVDVDRVVHDVLTSSERQCAPPRRSRTRPRWPWRR